MSKPLRITWINPGRIEQHNGMPVSDRADIRLRCIIPATELLNKGHDIAAVSIFDWHQWANSPDFYRRDLFIVGKAFLNLTEVIDHIHRHGGKVIIDLCDNIFEPPEDGLKPYYESMLPLADGVVTSSELLKTAVAPRLPKPLPVAAIPDCIEGKRLPPAFAPSDDLLKMLWFGFPNNLPLLDRELTALAQLARSIPIDLSVVTLWENVTSTSLSQIPEGIRINRVEWSLPAMEQELACTDIVIIPSDDAPARITKTPNRLITSLWAGRYVVAYPLPSYLDFAPFAGITKDLPAAIRQALDNPAAIPPHIAAGENFIAATYDNRRIAEAWLSFAERILSTQL
jgi:hypothetical protein